MTDSRLIDKDLEQALSVLNQGGIILYPTDTVWGLGCDATNCEAVDNLFMIKGRPGSKAMISLIHSLDSLKCWLQRFPEGASVELENSERPLTMIFDHPFGIAPALMAEDGSAAFRIPIEPFTNELAKRLGKPLVSTSANFSGEPTPASFHDIRQELIDRADYVCNYGRNKAPSRPSRILKITDEGVITVIRE